MTKGAAPPPSKKAYGRVSNAVNRTTNRRILLSEMGYLGSVFICGVLGPRTGSAQNHIKGRGRCVMARCSKVKEFRMAPDYALHFLKGGFARY